MTVSENQNSSLADAGSVSLNYTGTSGEMIPLILRNLVLMVLTLGLYRFWARTEIRKHIWSKIELEGDPLEYTGTGMEMFKGFLIALFAVFLPIGGLFFWAQVMVQQGNPLGGLIFLIVYPAMLWLAGLAFYLASRYRMTRTRWRGVRGAQLGNAQSFATKFFGYYLLTFVTLGLATPSMMKALWVYEANHKSFGSRRLLYTGPKRSLYGPFFLSVLLFVGGLIAGGLLIASMGSGALTGSGATPTGFAAILPVLIIYGVLLVVGPIAMSIFYAAVMREFYSNLTFGIVETRCSVTTGDMLKLIVTNVFIMIFSFGILFPITQMRSIRLVINKMQLTGALEPETLTRIEGDDVPTTGEGLAEGFDMGTI